MRSKSLIIVLLLILSIQVFSQAGSLFNVVDYGAVGDGKTLDTEAVREAVEACAVAGGTVVFPAGTYLIGSVDLKSNVDIYIQQGALILGSTNITDYEERIPKLKSYNDYFLKHSMFYAEKSQNISIRGEGIIDGQGGSFVITTNKKPDRYMNRPFIIRFVECSNVKVEGITLRSSAMWMQQYLACESLFIRGIKVYNHSNKNNDMIDIDGCKNVVISDCIGDSDDDALTLKSTSTRITENVTITNCVLSSHCNAIKFGTESTGGFKNITISNCVVKPSEHPTNIYGAANGISGITIGMVDGGVVDEILISNVRIDGPMVPIYMRLGNRGRKHTPDAPEPGVGTFKNVKIDNVIATNTGSNIGSSITGIPGHLIENVSLSNISIEYPGGGTSEDAAKVIDELEDHYPESTKWGSLPSYGFYIRHAENVTLQNVEVTYINKDVRSAIICEDVHNINLHYMKIKGSENSEPVIQLNNSTDAFITGTKVLDNADLFLKLKGTSTNNIYLMNNSLPNVKELFDTEDVQKETNIVVE